MKKTFFTTVAVITLFIFVVYLNLPNINFYNVEFVQPLFWFLIPVIFLLFLLGFLKNLKRISIFLTIVIFGVFSLLLLSQVEVTCSQIFCFSRNLSALTLSSIFSIIYFLVQFFKNRSQIR